MSKLCFSFVQFSSEWFGGESRRKIGGQAVKHHVMRDERLNIHVISCLCNSGGAFLRGFDRSVETAGRQEGNVPHIDGPRFRRDVERKGNIVELSLPERASCCALLFLFIFEKIFHRTDVLVTPSLYSSVRAKGVDNVS